MVASNARQVFIGLAAILFSCSILLGGMSSAILEGNPAIAFVPKTQAVALGNPVQITVIPGVPTLTPTPPLPTSSCRPPEGWVPYSLQPDETLAMLALRLKIKVQVLLDWNCIPSSGNLVPELIIYIPELPATATPTATSTFTITPTPLPSSTRAPTQPVIQCEPRRSWGRYIVRPGDTLYKISLAFYTSIYALQKANCMNNSVIRVGQVLYVPPVATRTPYLLPTPTRVIPTITQFVPTLPRPTPTAPIQPSSTSTPPTPPTSPPSPTAITPTTSVPPTNPPPATDTSVPTNPPAPTATQAPTKSTSTDESSTSHGHLPRTQSGTAAFRYSRSVIIIDFIQ